MRIHDFIDDRRRGKPHSKEQIQDFINAVVDQSATDAQLAAWLMAACINPLSIEEAGELTKAMAESGETIDLSELPRPWIDKHSTGGVGDKTTIVLTPMLAALGFNVVKMSGRGLGLTGGTIDKLESVPGFNVDLDPSQVLKQAKEIGLAVTAQTPSLAPADKRLYSLRNETSTVDSIPLIVSSILSKKIAGGSDLVIMDVKSGSGAFMKTIAEAKELSSALVEIGAAAGLEVRTVISNMEFPLGSAVGNLLEIREAFDVLNGAPGPVRDLCVHLAALALAPTVTQETLERASAVLDDGSALVKAKQWFAAQGADPAQIDDQEWPTASITETFKAPASGWIKAISARDIAQAAFELGAGRASSTSQIIATAGVELKCQIGDKVEKDQPLATIHAESQISQEVRTLLGTGIELSQSTVDRPKLIYE